MTEERSFYQVFFGLIPAWDVLATRKLFAGNVGVM